MTVLKPYLFVFASGGETSEPAKWLGFVDLSIFKDLSTVGALGLKKIEKLKNLQKAVEAHDRSSKTSDMITLTNEIYKNMRC